MKVFVYKKNTKEKSERVAIFNHVGKVEEYNGHVYIYCENGDIASYECRYFKTSAFQN